MRVLVCGGRNFADYNLLSRKLGELRPSLVIEGGARGADWLAMTWAVEHSVDRLRFEADWEAHGKAAGPIRNQRMLYEGKPDLVVAFPGGTGTADMVRRARAAGVEVMEVE